MPRSIPTLACLALAAALPGLAPARAADLPFVSSPPPDYGMQASGGGGFRVARVPLRPAPPRYDIYGYPIVADLPSPLAVGSGCPAAIQPNYDPSGNFAGYAPIPMCR